MQSTRFLPQVFFAHVNRALNVILLVAIPSLLCGDTVSGEFIDDFYRASIEAGYRTEIVVIEHSDNFDEVLSAIAGSVESFEKGKSELEEEDKDWEDVGNGEDEGPSSESVAEEFEKDGEDTERSTDEGEAEGVSSERVVRAYEAEEVNIEDLIAQLEEESNVFLEEDFGAGEKITLPQAIFFALKDNEGVGSATDSGTGSATESNVQTGLQTAFLNRESEVESLRVAENAFRPTWTVTLASNITRTHKRDGVHNSSVGLPMPGVALTQNFKTGGSMTFNWDNTYGYTKESARPFDASASSTLSLAFKQPLLKGGGFTIGSLALTNAYLSEESNINNLKKTVIDVITDTIQKYRSYIQAIQKFEIDKNSIVRSRKDFERTQELVAAGTRAETDLVERRRDLANKEFNFQDQRDSVDKSRIAFLRVLNMDTSKNVVPAELTLVELDMKNLPTVIELLAIAFLNDPSYLNQLITYRKSELNYIKAKNDLLWQLDFDASITSNGPGSNSVGRTNEKKWDHRDRGLKAGLTLTIPFNDRGRRKGIIDARIALRNAQISLNKKEQDMTASVKNNLRDIKKNIFQLKIARINTVLSAKRLDQKRIEVEAGESSSFELTGVENDLISTEKSELDTKINYMNSLAKMDQLLGTTLDTWSIDINRRTDNLPKVSDTLFGKIEIEEEKTTL